MSGGSFNSAGYNFGLIGFNHRTDSWDAETDYTRGDTVLYDESATYYCHTDIVGDSSNDNPTIDTAHWHVYAFEEGELDSAVLSATGDLLVKEQGALVNLPVGANGERLYFSANRRFEWFTPGIADGRTGIATRTVGGTLPVSERYAAREELETVHYFTISPPRGGSDGTTMSRSSGDFNLGTWATIVGELKYGTFNSAGNTTLDTPLSGSQIQKDGANIGNIRNGRFYRHQTSSFLGGLIDIDDRRADNVTSTTTTDTDEYIFDRRFFVEFDYSRKLFSGLIGPRILHEFDEETLEWQFGNLDNVPYFLDYIRGVSDTFTFLAAPSSDPTSTTRTIWQVGFIDSRNSNSPGIGTVDYDPTSTNNTRFILLDETYGSTSDTNVSGSYAQFAIFHPTAYGFRFPRLTQIAVPGTYEKLFLLDEAYQFDSYFFIAGDSLTGGSQFLVKMQDGSWQLHAGFESRLESLFGVTTRESSDSSATTTAMQVYPSTVVTRDHLCVSDSNYIAFSASQKHWNGSTGFTDVTRSSDASDNFIRFRNYFNAWKSGTGTVSMSYGSGNFTTTPNATLTVGSGTVKQIKCFYWWGTRTGTGYGTTDNDRHPADQRLTVFVVTDEGNIWIAAQEDNGYAPWTSLATRAVLNVPDITGTTSMAQLSGPWDGDVQRVEVKCFPRDFSGTYTGEDEGIGADPSVADNGIAQITGATSIHNVVVIVTSKSVYVHSHLLSVFNNNSRETTSSGYAHMFWNNFDHHHESVDRTESINLPIQASVWNNADLPSSIRSASERQNATWVRGDIPKGNIERVLISTGYGSRDVRLRVINDSGTMYTCNVGDYLISTRIVPSGDRSFTARLKFDIHPNNDGPITTPNNTGSNPVNRVF